MNQKLVMASALAVSVLVLGFGAVPCTADESAAKGAPNAEKMGWHLGVQAFSFYRYPFLETVDMVESLGLHYIEMIPFQRLSKDDRKMRTDHNMPPEVREDVRAKLKKAGIKVVTYGVAPLPNDETECRKVFDFAKAMGIETIVSEPPYEALDLIDKLCAEYEINVAIHNHPEPSLYWDPDSVLKACEGRSKRIGFCADTSHWRRSGVDVLETLKKCEGRLITLHFGDVSGKDIEALRESYKDGKKKAMAAAINKIPNVVFGEGDGDMVAWLAELKLQNFQGMFFIESFFEHKADVAVSKMLQSIDYFDSVAAKLATED
jgi:sugar phosphate isomerase/epimerase